ncbi:hypothetical protein EQV77_06205 [Halobacillus fulvus]|nr:hypothetical protein EQV77_06205 [Halobacillus fulvus]
MKKVISLLMFTLILSGCTLFASDLQKSFMDYVNEDLKPVGELEDEAITKLNSVWGENYTNDATLGTALEEEIIPTYQEVVDELKAIELEPEELKEIHQQFISGAESQLAGFETALEAIKVQDATMIEEANQLVMEGQAEIEEYKQNMQNLADEHDLEYTVEGM